MDRTRLFERHRLERRCVLDNQYRFGISSLRSARRPDPNRTVSSCSKIHLSPCSNVHLMTKCYVMEGVTF
jgi:hypothetical protein